jgi:hypothetical protein
MFPGKPSGFTGASHLACCSSSSLCLRILAKNTAHRHQPDPAPTTVFWLSPSPPALVISWPWFWGTRGTP